MEFEATTDSLGDRFAIHCATPPLFHLC